MIRLTLLITGLLILTGLILALYTQPKPDGTTR
jgi:hypothetical protein